MRCGRRRCDHCLYSAAWGKRACPLGYIQGAALTNEGAHGLVTLQSPVGAMGVEWA